MKNLTPFKQFFPQAYQRSDAPTSAPSSTQEIALVLLVLMLGACSSNSEQNNEANADSNQQQEMETVETKYQNSGYYLAIMEGQKLDPGAPAANAGIVNGLQGEVGTKVLKNYRTSTYKPKDGRASASGVSGGSGGTN
ncbi:hypothetical protein [Thalassotalea litorea]|uniref:hypothetical protein n=1 Tax=Thalassotalea litorea TaxID=2020715 RepID=UPI0037370B7F